MQLPLIVPEQTWKPELYFPPIQNAKRICIDVETKDPGLKTLGPGVRRPRSSYVVGIALAIDSGPSMYFPVRHEGDDNLDKDTVTEWCHAEFKKYKGEVVGANILYDLDWLGSEGIYFHPEATFLDVQHAEALLNEHRMRYNLNSLAEEYLGETKREEELRSIAKLYGIDPKSELWRLPAGYVGRYAIGDVELPLDILRFQETKLQAQNLTKIWKLETDLIPVMLAMRQKGIRIDEEKLMECETFFQEQESLALHTIKKDTGVDLTNQLWVAESCADVLRKLKIEFPLTEKTKAPSIASDWLKSIDNPTVQLIARGRRFNKARTTFCDSIKRHMTYGKIHPNFNQLKGDDGGTVTGRLSCNNPNIQQQPIRDKEIGRMFRGIYLPDEGLQYARMDYKEQEPKLALHFAILSKQRGYEELLKRYSEDPDVGSYGLISSELDRDTCKTVYLAQLYGAGGLKISDTLNKSRGDKGLPQLETVWREDDKGGLHEYPGPEATAIIDNFKQGAPWVIGLIRAVTRKARAKGYVKTLLGRHNRFPDIEFVYKATNKLIQGSAADQMKKALVDLYAAGHTPHIQVHDEIGISVPDEAQAIEIKEIMENAVQLKIPALVDYTLGANWGECK
jgi:DNA polymerase I-like protein with 3'-5' exonuclease and polymerase domains